jgi:hypothetical protein
MKKLNENRILELLFELLVFDLKNNRKEKTNESRK